jgi:hypothetical protein
MRNMVTRLILVAGVIAAPVLAEVSQEDENIYGQAQLLCEWRDAHVIGGNPPPLRFCSAGKSIPPQEARGEIDAWWNYWLGVSSDIAESFKGSLQDYGREKERKIEKAKLEGEREVANAEREREREVARAKEKRDRESEVAAEAAAAKARRAKHKRDLPNLVGQMTPVQLCHEYKDGHPQVVGQELVRRGLLTPSELSLVDRHYINVGMSEFALICSLGLARRHRTVTAAGEFIQYVYGPYLDAGDVYVYVENGVVVSFQDSR